MAPLIVRTISRYLLRQHVAPLGFALAALTSLMLIQQVAKQLSSLLGKGLPAAVIAEVFVLSLPFIVAVTLPMAVLVAVLHVFTRLASDNEITALQAGGVSVTRLVAPVLAGAAGVALLSFLWNDQLLPRTNHQLRTLQVDIARKKPSLTLLYDLSDAERRRIIRADSGRMAYSAGGRDLFLTLVDGDIEEVNRTDPVQFNRTFYRINRMRVSGVGNTFTQTGHDTYKSDREMSTCEMRQAARAAGRDADRAAADGRLVIENDLRRLVGLAPVAATPAPYVPDTAPPDPYCRALRRLGAWLLPREAEAQTPRSPPPTPPPPPLASSVSPLLVTPGAGSGEEQRVRDARTRAATYEVEIQKKYAIAAACLVFALVGVPVALRFQRGGVGLVIGMSVGVFTVYYVGLIAGEELGDRLFVSPFLAMWTPNLIFATAGLFGLWRIRKPGNAPHGGDWSDVVETAVRLLHWPGALLLPRWRGAP
ncbi:MAG: hypothetical protein DMD57_05475 [Gemmatimonadetes bacterium]|nr:MAG: hypothetical protein DMD57_05475 [Gemmatimonadota bacterium]